MQALVKRNQGSELDIADYGRKGSNVQRSAQKITLMFSHQADDIKPIFRCQQQHNDSEEEG